MKRRKKQNKTSCSNRCSAFIWRLAFRRMPILAVFAELSAEETAAQLRSWPVPGFWTGREQLAAQLPADLRPVVGCTVHLIGSIPSPPCTLNRLYSEPSKSAFFLSPYVRPSFRTGREKMTTESRAPRACSVQLEISGSAERNFGTSRVRADLWRF